ncbi:MAG: carbon storage regulator CsrA [Planctomycetota bacterium]
MLVLSRQRDETIMIGDAIEVTVVDIRGDKVRLGITAPTRIAVHRKEVYEAIRAENERAARSIGGDLDSLNGSVPAGLRQRGASLRDSKGGALSARQGQSQRKRA